MSTRRSIIALFILGLLGGSGAQADDLAVVDFIVRHSPLVKAVREANRTSPWNNFKLEGRASAYQGVIGSTADRGALGIVLTWPLLDPREKAEREKNIKQAEAQVREEASNTLIKLREAQSFLVSIQPLLEIQEKQTDLLQRRMVAGVDYQKNYFEGTVFQLREQERFNRYRAEAAGYTVRLLSLVEVPARNRLAEMIDRAELKSHKK